MPKSIYFDYNPIFSHNAEVNIITALRGVGKSYGMKEKICNAFLKEKRISIWARRTDEQLKDTKSTFLTDLKVKDKTGKYNNFYIVGDFLYYKEVEKRKIERKDGTEEEVEEIKNIYVVMKFISLNVGGNARGLALDFDNIKYFVFDEFIEEDTTKYLKNEIKKFMSVLQSCLRLADAKVILLSNALSSANPYFKLFNVKITNNLITSYYLNIPVELDNGQREILKLRIAFQYGADAKAYKEKARQSIAGKIALLANYGQMSINDKFILDDYTHIIERQKMPKLDFKYNICYDKIYLGVYSTKNNITYISKPIQSGLNYIIEDIQEASKNDTNILVNKKHFVVKCLMAQYSNGFVAFEDIHIQQAFINMLNACL